MTVYLLDQYGSPYTATLFDMDEIRIDWHDHGNLTLQEEDDGGWWDIGLNHDGDGVHRAEMVRTAPDYTFTLLANIEVLYQGNWVTVQYDLEIDITA